MGPPLKRSRRKVEEMRGRSARVLLEQEARHDSTGQLYDEQTLYSARIIDVM